MTEHDHILVEAIYAAAMGPESWPGLLNLLMREFGGCSAALLATDVARPRSELTLSCGVLAEPAVVDAYRNHYSTMDPAPGRFALQPVGQVAMTTELFAEMDANCAAFFNEFFSPLELVDSLGVTLERNGRRAAVLGVQRDRIAGPFGSVERRRLETLIPHLQRALTLYERIGHHREQGEALTMLLDRLSAAVFLVDRELRVHHMNQEAAAIAGRSDGVVVRRGGVLAAMTAAAVRDLERLVGRAAAAGEGGMMTIAREHGQPYSTLVTPLARPDDAQHVGSGPLVAVVLTEPGRLPPGAESAATVRFGLTRGESELLASLLSGHTLQAHCARRGISVNTGKFHMKALFAKTGTRRQADLVRVGLEAIGIIRFLPPLP